MTRHGYPGGSLAGATDGLASRDSGGFRILTSMPREWTSFEDEREGFTHWDASLLAQEIATQCGFAIRAFRDIGAPASAGSPFVVYYHVQAFLAATGAVSRLLWPAPRFAYRAKAEAVHLAERRKTSARLMREAIGDDGLEPLRDRTLRNALTHFDEWLTEYIVQRHPVYADLNLYEDEPGMPPAGRLRHLDPRTLILSLRGETLWLPGVYEAILLLSNRLAAGSWQLLIPPEQVAGS